MDWEASESRPPSVLYSHCLAHGQVHADHGRGTHPLSTTPRARLLRWLCVLYNKPGLIRPPDPLSRRCLVNTC